MRKKRKNKADTRCLIALLKKTRMPFILCLILCIYIYILPSTPPFHFFFFNKGKDKKRKMSYSDIQHTYTNLFSRRKFCFLNVCSSPVHQVRAWVFHTTIRRWNIRWYRWLRNLAWYGIWLRSLIPEILKIWWSWCLRCRIPLSFFSKSF